MRKAVAFVKLTGLVAISVLSLWGGARGQSVEEKNLAQSMVGIWAIGGVDRCSSAPYQISFTAGTLSFRDRNGKITKESVEENINDRVKTRSLDSKGGAPAAAWIYQKRSDSNIFVTNMTTGRSFAIFRCGEGVVSASAQNARQPASLQDPASGGVRPDQPGARRQNNQSISSAFNEAIRYCIRETSLLFCGVCESDIPKVDEIVEVAWSPTAERLPRDPIERSRLNSALLSREIIKESIIFWDVTKSINFENPEVSSTDEVSSIVSVSAEDGVCYEAYKSYLSLALPQAAEIVKSRLDQLISSARLVVEAQERQARERERLAAEESRRREEQRRLEQDQARQRLEQQRVQQERLAAQRAEQQRSQREAEAERIANFRRDLEAYRGRRKNILEEIFNYQSFGAVEGYVDVSELAVYWVSGEGGHKCIMSLKHFNQVRLHADPELQAMADALYKIVIDIREFNERGFRVSPRASGDEKAQISHFGLGRTPVLERLKNAWQLAFKECPGKRGAF